jgi:Leucine-rich repeat (LRR) protein
VIDNLLGLEKLTKLQLDNNIIVKIEGLDSLVNLRWLDLSFNLIETIENLDKCTQIEDLTLYKNCISKLSGLDNLNKLNVLSIGSNKLKSLEDSVDYLRKLRNNLQVLRIDNNQFQRSRSTEYKKYIIARLKSLMYIDYELIEKEERNRAYEDHKDDMAAQEQEGQENNNDE